MRYDYEQSLRLSSEPFYALIMAAMRIADTDNAAKLKREWPGVWRELQERYHAPGGELATDDQSDEDTTVYLVSPFNRN